MFLNQKRIRNEISIPSHQIICSIIYYGDFKLLKLIQFLQKSKSKFIFLINFKNSHKFMRNLIRKLYFDDSNSTEIQYFSIVPIENFNYRSPHNKWLNRKRYANNQANHRWKEIFFPSIFFFCF